MGREKKAKPLPTLPYNVYKMATSSREILTSKSRGIWRLEKYCFLHTDFVKWCKKKISWKFICTFFSHTVSRWKPFHLCYLLVPLVYNGKRQCIDLDSYLEIKHGKMKEFANHPMNRGANLQFKYTDGHHDYKLQLEICMDSRFQMEGN